jgi:hypothetical protein
MPRTFPLRAGLLIALLGAISLCIGLLVSLTLAPAPVEAGLTCGVLTDCSEGGQTTGSSTMKVRHEIPAYTTDNEVQITGTETVAITATWQTADDDNAPLCSCDQISATVQVAVTWNAGTGAWSVACTGCNAATGPIRSVGICANSKCGSFPSHQSDWYKLLVVADLIENKTCTGGTGNNFLHQVMYSVSPSQGQRWDDACGVTAGTVDPIYASYRNTDPGAFECGKVCGGAAVGPEILVTYQ